MSETDRSPGDTDSVNVEEIIEEIDRQTTNDDNIDQDCRALWVSRAFNTVCTFLYGYALFYQNLDNTGALFNRVFDPRIQPYGLHKYLTYNSLLIQFISSSLHLLSSIFPKYRIIRDIVFTALAYPIGSLVVYTFWTVWWTQGRDQIYPIAIETYYPMWLNHVTHTMVAPINIAQAYLTYHRYIKKGSVITLLFMWIYGSYVLYIRCNSGTFVYPYLNQMNRIPFAIYLASVNFCTLALYESGSFITAIFHDRKIRSHID